MGNNEYLYEKIYLKTLTPIFIGQNQANDLSPYSDFIQIGNEIYYIAQKKFEEALASKDGLMDKYVNLVRQMIDKSRTQSNFNLQNFIQQHLGDIEEFSDIKIPVDQNLKHTHIRRFITSSGRPFIPGSTIKGEFRTAIIYDWLTNSEAGRKIIDKLNEKIKNISERILELQEKKVSQGLSDEESKELKKLTSKSEVEKEFEKIYDEQKLFGFMSEDNQSGFDSRHIQVSDSKIFDFSNLSILKLCRIKLRDCSEVSPFPCETLNANLISNFNLKLVRSFEQNQLIKFNNISIKDIFEILNSFSLASITYEIESFDSFHNKSNSGNNKKTDYSKVLDFYNKLFDTINKSNNEYAIIRLGAGKTFFDNSIGLVIYNYNKDVFNKYRKLLEIGKNSKTKKIVEGRFPTTRTIVDATKLPIGWLAVSLDRNSIDSLDFYESKTLPISTITDNTTTTIVSSKPEKKYTLAQIIDDKSKPPKVKILEGEHLNKECQLTNVRLEGLGLKSGARVFVELVFQKKVLQKADYKGKPEE
ncbi:MAG: type III-A CRISPR-associated RAMP protein Csm5 [Ignavibacteriaceae bacterium]